MLWKLLTSKYRFICSYNFTPFSRCTAYNMATCTHSVSTDLSCMWSLLCCARPAACGWRRPCQSDGTLACTVGTCLPWQSTPWTCWWTGGRTGSSACWPAAGGCTEQTATGDYRTASSWSARVRLFCDSLLQALKYCAIMNTFCS